MNELKKLIPAYLQATKVIVGFCMYAIPASDLPRKIAKKKKRIDKKNNKRINKI